MNEDIFACIIITVIYVYLLFVRSYFTPPVDEEKHCRRNFRVCYVTFEGIFYLCCGFFFWHGSAWHASGCQKGAAEEPLRGCLNSKP